MAEKPELYLLPPNPTVEQISLNLYRSLTGKEPSEEEVNELKSQAAMDANKGLETSPKRAD